jgi:hypothetical protein
MGKWTHITKIQISWPNSPERSVLPPHPVIVSKLFKSCGLVGILGMPEERRISFLQMEKHV